MRRLLASILCLAMTTAAPAETITISAEPIPEFQRLAATEAFGPFTWRGGLTLTSPAADFGGLSGLVIGKGCEELLAVSDMGHWLQARLQYDDKGRLSGMSSAGLQPLRNSEGGSLGGKVQADAEALTRLADGKLLVGFERLVRFGRYEGVKAKFRPVPHPKDMDTGPDNAQIEAVGQLADGRLLAIGEGQFDASGNIRAWAWKGGETAAFTLTRHGDYRVTDLAVMADGSVLTLERRFTTTSMPGMAVRRFKSSAIARGAMVAPELLLEATAPAYVIDNMEGIAVCERQGETRVTLVSDDNFSPLQSTILLQFAYGR